MKYGETDINVLNKKQLPERFEKKDKSKLVETPQTELDEMNKR